MFYVHTQIVRNSTRKREMSLGGWTSAFIPRTNPLGAEGGYLFLLGVQTPQCYQGREATSIRNGIRHTGYDRFVSGQYSRAVLHGGMIGYVQDGTSRAIRNVEAAIAARHVALGMKPPGEFEHSAVFPRLDRASTKTHHQRQRGQSAFHIHHLFMASNPALVPTATVVTQIRRGTRCGSFKAIR